MLIRDRIIGFRRVKASELRPNPKNWRTHPQAQQDALRGVLAEVGYVDALLARELPDGSLMLLDGHLRAETTPDMEVPVLVVDLDDAEAAKVLATFDPLSAMAEADSVKLDAILREFETGSEELAKMLDELAKEAGCEWASGGNGEAAPAFDCEDLLDDDDNPEAEFLAPFPWFGGKSRVARQVWKRFGDVRTFIEPFFGSGACLLNRPLPFDGTETVNDFDGLVANFWRAVKSDPDKVAEWADWPVNENDLHARHIWLVNQKDSLQTKLEGDPDYYDAKVAGWWCWGMACWIGSGFCAGDGPWGVEEVDGERQLVHLGSAGQGVNRKRVREADDAGNPGRGERGLLAWMQALAERLRRTRVCCGDWTRICGGNSGDSISHMVHAGPCGVFLDPPYSFEAQRDMGCYRVDSGTVAHAVREWAIAHGDDPRFRIALCGYEGEHAMPDNWTKVGWKAQGGMGNLGDNRGKQNAYRERIWFSPHCLKAERAETV